MLAGELGKDEEVVAKDDMVFGDDNLAWGVIGEAIGASEPTKVIRQHTRLTATTPIVEEEHEEHIFDDEEQVNGEEEELGEKDSE